MLLKNKVARGFTFFYGDAEEAKNHATDKVVRVYPGKPTPVEAAVAKKLEKLSFFQECLEKGEIEDLDAKGAVKPKAKGKGKGKAAKAPPAGEADDLAKKVGLD